MYNNSSKYLILIFLLWSCASSNQETPRENEQASWVYDQATLSQKESNCSKSETCSSAKVIYPQFSEQKKLNRLLEKAIQARIGIYLPIQNDRLPLDSLLKLFIQQYKDFKSAFPTSNTPWQYSLELKPTSIDPVLLSIRFEEFAYTGGAHAISQTGYLNYRTDPIQLVADSAVLAEDRRSIYEKIKPFFPDNAKTQFPQLSDFVLPKEIGFFSPDTLEFYYNPYEIGTYAEGTISIKVPAEQLTLKPD
jgi:hypothetical protein